MTKNRAKTNKLIKTKKRMQNNDRKNPTQLKQIQICHLDKVWEHKQQIRILKFHLMKHFQSSLTFSKQNNFRDLNKENAAFQKYQVWKAGLMNNNFSLIKRKYKILTIQTFMKVLKLKNREKS